MAMVSLQNAGERNTRSFCWPVDVMQVETLASDGSSADLSTTSPTVWLLTDTAL